MTERHEPPAAGRPISTGEFRATPDVSANTAEFRAFAEAGAEPDRPWGTGGPKPNVARLALIVLGVAAVLAIVALLVVR